MKLWHYRTVKAGRVKMLGRIYAPDENSLPYDGRLNGQRFLFALYPSQLDLAALWGTEEEGQCEACAENSEISHEHPKPQLVDGFYHWYFWHEVPA